MQTETVEALLKIPKGTVAQQSSMLGIAGGEPLLLAMDGLLRYAKAYRKAYQSNLSDDGVLGAEWLNAAKGIRGLLNGNGVVAMERNISTDSKDNGAIEDIFWAALKVAGFDEKDL